MHDSISDHSLSTCITVGLILKPKVPHLILSTGQDIEFTTQVIGAEGRVRIKFHRSDKDYSLSGDSYETDFEKPGR